ncbi:MAG: Rieske 2Fe-2S domain-containing protein [Caldilineaceae bacterium]|nr:Rieske 2Fe-2S domain-containing protein [Caldilineaceae bacterium]
MQTKNLIDLNGYIPSQQLETAWTLPAAWYTHPASLPLEKERIFYRTWQWVGAASLVQRPGDLFTYDLYGEPLVVTRGQDGALCAFYNVCLHRAGPILRACTTGRRNNCAFPASRRRIF